VNNEERKKERESLCDTKIAQRMQFLIELVCVCAIQKSEERKVRKTQKQKIARKHKKEEKTTS
jgi:hypothetical protein